MGRLSRRPRARVAIVPVICTDTFLTHPIQPRKKEVIGSQRPGRVRVSSPGRPSRRPATLLYVCMYVCTYPSASAASLTSPRPPSLIVMRCCSHSMTRRMPFQLHHRSVRGLAEKTVGPSATAYLRAYSRLSPGCVDISMKLLLPEPVR